MQDAAFGQLRRLKPWRLLPRSWRSRVAGWLADNIPYQKVVYNGQVLASGRDRTHTYRLIFPQPPVGQTILDVGCYLGAYGFMAVSEGAQHYTGVEIRQEYATKAQRLIRRAAVDNLEVIHADVFALEFDHPFNVVMCLNVLHHMGTIQRADELLSKLYALATQRLVLMVPTPVDGDQLSAAIRVGGRYFLHISGRYFEERFATDQVEVVPVHPKEYGPNRVAVLIQKQKAVAERITN